MMNKFGTKLEQNDLILWSYLNNNCRRDFTMMKRLSLISFLAILLTLSGASEIFAQQPSRPNQSEKTRPAQKTPDADVQKTEENPQSTDEALRIAITGLSNQLAILASELRRLREETQRNSERIEMLMYEERLGKIEAKMDEALNEKMNLDAREQEIQRRQRNIPQEALLRGGIRREEAEAAVKADLQRALDDVRERQENSQKRIADLQQQSDRISTRLEAIRKKLEPPEKKDPNQ